MQIALVIPEFPANVRSDTYAIDYGRILGAEWMARSAGWNQPEAYVVLDTDPRRVEMIKLTVTTKSGAKTVDVSDDADVKAIIDQIIGEHGPSTMVNIKLVQAGWVYRHLAPVADAWLAVNPAVRFALYLGALALLVAGLIGW